MRGLKRLLMWAGFLLLIGAALAGCARDNSPVGPSNGKLAPDFTLPNLDGTQTTLSSFRGKPVIVTFWTTDCPYCRQQQPYLVSAYQDYAAWGLTVLEVNAGDSPSSVRNFVAANGISVPVLLDEGNHAGRTYRIPGVPSNFLIDSKGVIREVHFGSFSSYDDLRQSLTKIL